MNIKKYIFALSLSMLLFSCKEDVDTVNGVSLSETEMSFYADGGFQEVEIKAAGEWMAKSNQPWCLVSPANGSGDAVCKIQTDHSTRYDGREATIQFVSGSDIKEIKISQMGYAPTIKVVAAPEETLPYYKEENASYFDLEVEGNVKFEVNLPLEDGALEWVNTKGEKYSYTPSETRPEKKTFRFYYDINAEEKVREQIIEFVQTEVAEGTEGVKTEFVIKQDCLEQIPPSRKGDSLAVITLSKLMNVFGTSWDPSRPITHWDNVATEEINGELRVVGLSLVMFETDRSVPFIISKLTELRSLQLRGNSNAYLKSIKLGDEITKLKKLRSLSLYSYGISELPAPDKMAEMKALEELNLYGNTFMKLDGVLASLDGLKEQLKYLDISANRRYDGIKNLTDVPFLPYLPEIKGYKSWEQMGLTGEIPNKILEFKALEYLALSNNYLQGNMPGSEDAELPKLRTIKINQNFLSGECPKWMLNHVNVGCWDTEVLILNQIAGGVDSNRNEAKLTGKFVNKECPDSDKEAVETALYLPQLTEYEKKEQLLPMVGYWRYYENFNLLK